jgi:hypothetical protein
MGVASVRALNGPVISPQLMWLQQTPASLKILVPDSHPTFGENFE